MHQTNGQVRIWVETVSIPTYGVGKPNKNPMFLEKRVYQGSSGKVYPLPVIDSVEDEKHDVQYSAVFLENDYISVMVLPELGGRIQRAYDKTNGCDFVYYNRVIKPALVGLCGPWISGGIEFNWPQHHRPTTFSPVDYIITENPDQSKSLLCSEVDQMYGTKGMMTFTLYPDRAYIEIKGQLYNRTPLPQTFLWWANPAVSVNDDTQSVFPPDVHAVYDHGKRDVSRFPISDSTYYKHDYSPGTDISRYKNIPVPTSYMAYRSAYDFVGGYDYGKKVGILHVADHHISPGKKQWTWGCGDFGRAWDRNLTDSDGPYIELMTGVYTDNQPDFTWLMPFEEKVFTQYFMPYKEIADVKNATTDAAVNLIVRDGTAKIMVYATARFDGALIQLSLNGKVIFEKTADISPLNVFSESVSAGSGVLKVSVFNCGKLLVSYTAGGETKAELPSPAQAAKLPCDIQTNEELYLTGQHIEQYRHATFKPDDYYIEGLKRDAGDSRINTAYGMLLLRRGCFKESEPYFNRAIERITWKNPNPADSEPYYALGLCLFYQGRYDEAYDAFYKSVWSDAQQERGYYYLAAIDCRLEKYDTALEHIERALVKNSRSIKARALHGVLLRLTNSCEAADVFTENIRIDPFDYISRLELARLSGENERTALKIAGNRPSTFIEMAEDYACAGLYADAARALELCQSDYPMLEYYKAYCVSNYDMALCNAYLEKAALAPSYLCFANKLMDINVLTFAAEHSKNDSKAPYYLGCLFYDKHIYDRAAELWELSAELDGSFPTVWRNLALAYYNKQNKKQQALRAMEKAYALDETDSRIFLERDQLYKKLGVLPEERLSHYEAHRDVFDKRDDLRTEYAVLLNTVGRHEQAYEYIMSRKFHPWEGGEGRITGQYSAALLELAKQKLDVDDYAEAEKLLKKALVYPENLGEGKLEGAKDNDIYYFMGIAQSRQGKKDEALCSFKLACLGSSVPSDAMYYNDQPADKILYQGLALRELGSEDEAKKRFGSLINYGRQHIDDAVRIDYFAVSLPDLQLFDEDLSLRNRINCLYFIGLGHMGLGDAAAMNSFKAVLELDAAHQGALFHLRMLSSAE